MSYPGGTISLINRHRARIFKEWRAHKMGLGDRGLDLLAVMEEHKDDPDVLLLIGPRQDLIDAIGMGLGKLSDLGVPAYEKEPRLFPGCAIWLLVHRDKEVSVMRLLDMPIGKRAQA